MISDRSKARMQTMERKRVRSKREQLVTLINGWDPEGKLESGAPRDEYAPLADDLLAFLAGDPSEEEIKGFLDERFGTIAEGTAQFAKKVFTWFAMASSEE